jgi:hypothetical protein
VPTTIHVNVDWLFAHRSPPMPRVWQTAVGSGRAHDLLYVESLAEAAERAASGKGASELVRLIEVYAPRLMNPCSHPERAQEARYVDPRQWRAHRRREAAVRHVRILTFVGPCCREAIETQLKTVEERVVSSEKHSDVLEAAILSTSLVVSDALNLHEDLALELTRQSASHAVPSHPFFSSVVSKALIPSEPGDAEWKEALQLTAMLYFFWHRSRLLQALHLILEAAGRDGATLRDAAHAVDHHEEALAIRTSLRLHVIDANVSAVRGVGMRVPSEGAPALYTAKTMVAGRGLAHALMAGIVSLTHDMWHARLRKDPLRVVRADFDRVRVARCLSQFFRVFEPRITHHHGLERGEGGGTSHEWPADDVSRKGPVRSKRNQWLPLTPAAGELGSLISLLRWMVTVPLQSSPVHGEANADLQVCWGLLLAIFAACPEHETALVAPRRTVLHPGDAKKAPPGAGDSSMDAVALEDEQMPGAREEAARLPSPGVRNLQARSFRARAVAVAVGEAVVDSMEFVHAVTDGNALSGGLCDPRSPWAPWCGVVCLALLGCVYCTYLEQVEARVAAEGVMSEDVMRRAMSEASRTKWHKTLVRLLSEARSLGACKFLSRLAASPRFAATEVPARWTYPRLHAALSVVAGMHVQLAGFPPILTEFLYKPSPPSASASSGRFSKVLLGDTVVDVAKAHTVLVRADPELATQLLHPCGSVEDAHSQRELEALSTGVEPALVAGSLNAAFDAYLQEQEAERFDDFADHVDDEAKEIYPMHVPVSSRFVPSSFVTETPAVKTCWLQMLLTHLANEAERLAVKDLEAKRASIQVEGGRSSGQRLGMFDAFSAPLDADNRADEGMSTTSADALTGKVLTNKEFPEEAQRCLAAAVGLLSAVACGPLCADGLSSGAHVSAIVTGREVKIPHHSDLSLAWTLGSELGVGADHARHRSPWHRLLLLPQLLHRLDPRVVLSLAVPKASFGERVANAQAISEEALHSMTVAMTSPAGERLALCDLALLQALLTDHIGSQAIAAELRSAGEDGPSSLSATSRFNPFGSSPARFDLSIASHGGTSFAEDNGCQTLVQAMLHLIRTGVTLCIKGAAFKTIAIAARDQTIAEATWRLLERSAIVPHNSSLATIDPSKPDLLTDLEVESKERWFVCSAGYCSMLQSLLSHDNALITTASLGLGVRDLRTYSTGISPYVDHAISNIFLGRMLQGDRSQLDTDPSVWLPLAHSLGVMDALLRGYTVNWPPNGPAQHEAEGLAHDVAALDDMGKSDLMTAIRDLVQPDETARADKHFSAPFSPSGSPFYAASGSLADGSLASRIVVCASKIHPSDPRYDFSSAAHLVWELGHPGRTFPRSPAMHLLEQLLTASPLRSTLVQLLRAAGGAEGAARSAAASLGWARTPADQLHSVVRGQLHSLKVSMRTRRTTKYHQQLSEWRREKAAKDEALRSANAGASATTAAASANPFAQAGRNPFAQSQAAPAPAPTADSKTRVEQAQAELKALESRMPKPPASLPMFVGRERSDKVCWEDVRSVVKEKHGHAVESTGENLLFDASLSVAAWGFALGGSSKHQSAVTAQRQIQAETEALGEARAFEASSLVGDVMAVAHSLPTGASSSRASFNTVKLPVGLAVWRERCLVLVCSILEQASRLDTPFIEAARSARFPIEATPLAEGLTRERIIPELFRIMGYPRSRDSLVALSSARLFSRIVAPDGSPASASSVMSQVVVEAGHPLEQYLCRLFDGSVADLSLSDQFLAALALSVDTERQDKLSRGPWPPLSVPDAPTLPGMASTAHRIVGPGLGLGVSPVLCGRPLPADLTIVDSSAHESHLVCSAVPLAEHMAAAALSADTLLFTLQILAKRHATGEINALPFLCGLVDSSGKPCRPVSAQRVAALHGERGTVEHVRVRFVNDDIASSVSLRDRPAPLLERMVRCLVEGALAGPVEGIHRRRPLLALNIFRIIVSLCTSRLHGGRARQFVQEVVNSTSGGADPSESTHPFFVMQLRSFFAALEMTAVEADLAEAELSECASRLEQIHQEEAAVRQPIPPSASIPERKALAAWAREVRSHRIDLDAARARKYVALSAVATLRDAVAEAQTATALDLAAMCLGPSPPARQISSVISSLLAPAPPREDAAELGRAESDAAAALRNAAGGDAVMLAAEASRAVPHTVIREPLLEALISVVPMNEDRPPVKAFPILTSIVRAYEEAAARSQAEIGTSEVVGGQPVLLFDEEVIQSLARATARQRLSSLLLSLGGSGSSGSAVRWLPFNEEEEEEDHDVDEEEGKSGEETTPPAFKSPFSSRARQRLGRFHTSAGEELRAWRQLAEEVRQEAKDASQVHVPVEDPDGMGDVEVVQDSKAFQLALASAYARSIEGVVSQALELARERNHSVKLLASAARVTHGWASLVSTLMAAPAARLALGAIVSRVPIASAFAGAAPLPESSAQRMQPRGFHVSVMEHLHRDSAGNPDWASRLDHPSACVQQVPLVATALLEVLLERAVASSPVPSAILDSVALATCSLVAGVRAGYAPVSVGDRLGRAVSAMTKLVTLTGPASVTSRGSSFRARGLFFSSILHLLTHVGFGSAPGNPSVAGRALGNAGLAPIVFGSSSSSSAEAEGGVVGGVGGKLSIGQIRHLSDEAVIRMSNQQPLPKATPAPSPKRGVRRTRQGEVLSSANGAVENDHPEPLAGSQGWRDPLGLSAGVSVAQAIAAADYAHHDHAVAFSSALEAINGAGDRFWGQLCHDATKGPCFSVGSDRSGAAPLAEVRVAALSLLGALLAAPGAAERLYSLETSGGIAKLLAAVVDADAIEDAALRALGHRPADGSIPEAEDSGRSVKAKLDTKPSNPLHSLLEGLGGSRSGIGQLQGALARAVDVREADRVVSNLNKAALQAALVHAEACVSATLWVLARVAATREGAKALTRFDAPTALSGLRWLRWARVECRDIALGARSHEAQQTISARLRPRLTAICRLLWTLLWASPGNPMTVAECLEFLRVHVDLLRVPLRQVVALPNVDALSIAALVMQLLAKLKQLDPSKTAEFLSDTGLEFHEISSVRGFARRH